MDLFEHRYYKINGYLLSAIGGWPYQNQKLGMIYKLFSLMCLSVSIAAHIGKMTLSIKNLDNVMDVLPVMIISLDSTLVLCNFHFNSKYVLNLLNKIKSDWMTCKGQVEIEIMQSYAENGRIYVLIYVVYAYIGISIMLVMSMAPIILDIVVPLDESRPKKHPLPANYMIIDEQKYFYPILLHMIIETFIIITSVIASDTLFLNFIHHACGKFAIIGHYLEHATRTDKFSSNENLPGSNDIIYRNIVYCIIQHREAVAFVSSIESLYSRPLFIQVALNMICMSLTLAKAVLWLGDNSEVTMTISWIGGQLIHIFVMSFPGQMLIDHSQLISTKAYDGLWYNAPVNAQKLLILISRRCLTPCYITLGKMFVLSFENYIKLIETSVSYCMVLSSLH